MDAVAVMASRANNSGAINGERFRTLTLASTSEFTGLRGFSRWSGRISYSHSRGYIE